jgi:NAD(P)-dependent dehydrogenase (short-subunit alcohol dehydrogenase family)
MRLSGKVAVITGAGSGMGRAMAEMFAAEGAKVVCADISGEQEKVAAGIGANAFAIRTDVSKEADIQAMIAKAEERFGRLDILVNNAGISGDAVHLHEQTTENWERVHAVNIRGPFLGMKYGIQSMLKTGGGAIVNVSSASGVVGWNRLTVYGSAKAGLNHMTRTAALEYADRNIRVNAIAPGLIWTGMIRGGDQYAEPPKMTYPGAPMNRWGRSRDIAAAALFLVSDDASYVTGVVLPVDGGYTIGYSGLEADRPKGSE